MQLTFYKCYKQNEDGDLGIQIMLCFYWFLTKASRDKGC